MMMIWHQKKGTYSQKGHFFSTITGGGGGGQLRGRGFTCELRFLLKGYFLNVAIFVREQVIKIIVWWAKNEKCTF